MARSHNPFAPKEASTVETPWGVFEVASPNKERLAEIATIQEEARKLGDDPDIQDSVLLGLRTAAAGLKNGEEFLAKASEAWDAGELTLEQIRGTASFVSEEMQGGTEAGND